MFWNTSTRIYTYRPARKVTTVTTEYKRFINEYNSFHYKHMFFIRDIPQEICNYVNIEEFQQRYPLFDNMLKELSTAINPKIRIHFVGMRNGNISKKTAKKFKQYVRDLCSMYGIPTSCYTLATYKNFYVVLDSGYTYRITGLPNTPYSGYTMANNTEDKSTLIRISGTIGESIVDGIGMRYVVFVQGCPHHCEGCHNPETWEFERGRFITVDNLFKDIIKNPLLDGITYSGGEPVLQAEALMELTRKLSYYYVQQGKDFDFTMYTGYTLEQLLKHKEPKVSSHGNTYRTKKSIYISSLVDNMDYIVDGEFELNHKSLECPFRGSTNQKMYKQDKPNHTFTEIFPVE